MSNEVVTIHCHTCGDSDDPLCPNEDASFVFHPECMADCIVCGHLVPVDGAVVATDYGLAHEACCLPCDRCGLDLPADQFESDGLQVCTDCVTEAMTDDSTF